MSNGKWNRRQAYMIHGSSIVCLLATWPVKLETLLSPTSCFAVVVPSWPHPMNYQQFNPTTNQSISGHLSPNDVHKPISQCVLERAAKNHGLSVQELQEVPEGSTRRNMHDDITCVVFFLKGDRNTDGLGSLQGADSSKTGFAITSKPPPQ